jgi:DNA repair protein RecO (recombination protein O)
MEDFFPIRPRASIDSAPLNSTHAILLRRTRLSDTSWVVTWLTQAHGRLKTAAKGARRPRSPFAGKLDLFFLGDISYAHSRSSDLHALREVVLLRPFGGLRADFLRAELAAYFVELLELVTEPEQPVPELFDLLLRALGYLDTGRPTRRALVHFEAELARLLGIHGQEGVTPVIAIGRACNAIPAARPALLKRLAAAEKPPRSP